MSVVPKYLADAAKFPLKICLLGYRSHPYGGGQGVYLRYLSKALVEMGHQVDVISGQPYPHLDERVNLIKLPGLNMYERDLGSLTFKEMMSLTNLIEWWSKLTGAFGEPYCFGRRASKYLLKKDRQKYDIIHDNQSLSYGMLHLQKHFPFVMTIHHPITYDLRIALEASNSIGGRWLIRRWYGFLKMQKQVAGKLNNIVTVSKASQQDIAQDFDLPAERICVQYNGIDTQVFKPLEKIKREDNLLMATASADQPMKGLAYLLKAYAKLIEMHPHLRLLIIGKPKKDGDTQQLLVELGLEDRVEFVSGIHTYELVKYYAQATVAVVPSLYEGFGLPAGEAMACGVPLVSTTGGALPEVVGDAGILVEPGDENVLADAIHSLLADGLERDRLARAGRERIENSFCWRELAKTMTSYYQDVIVAFEQDK